MTAGPSLLRGGPAGTRRSGDERGATIVLTALMLPVVLAATGLGLETLVLTGSQRELQHAADLGALTAAAQTPLVDAGVPGLLDTPNADAVACEAADLNLGSSPLTTGFGTAPSCSATAESDAALRASALGLLGITNAANLLPALLTPQVRTTVTTQVDTPMRGLLSPSAGATTLAVEGVARRRFKNLVVLPVARLTPLCDVLLAPLALLGLDAILAGVPGLCELDATALLGGSDDVVWNALDEVGSTLGGDLGALTCGFATDAADLLDSGGSAPTMEEIVESAAAADEDVLVAIVGTSAIPALDVAIVAADDLAPLLGGGSTADLASAARLAGAGNTIASARGLFRASLIDTAGDPCP